MRKSYHTLIRNIFNNFIALYENLIVVAFDSTPCDENSSPLGTELTEMAWLTYDMALHQVNNTKQFFIKPDYAPKVLGERLILRSASPLKDVVQQVPYLSYINACLYCLYVALRRFSVS
jgi:hypothetical protein